jgi:UDP-hydrolysing UDP-N-acetyl-D-glucosamine 2-epimerase
VAAALGRAGADVSWIAIGPANRRLPGGRYRRIRSVAPPSGKVAATAAYIAEVQQQLTDALIKRRPDFIVLLGDRNEILAAACAACLLRIPFCQIHAGELAVGQTDNRVRHAVSRMADLLFAPDNRSSRRLIAWGEPRSCVFHVGSPFLDSLCPIAPLKSYRGLKPLEYILCAHHSVSPDDEAEYRQAEKVFRRVNAERKRLSSHLGREAKMIFIEPSPDPGRAGIIRRWREAQKGHPGVALYQQRMPRAKFLQLLTHAAKVVANSSSLFTEAAPLGVPMVLMGNRQKGRVLMCPTAPKRPVLMRPLAGGPYGRPGAAARIASSIMRFLGGARRWRAKEFADIDQVAGNH